MPYTMGCCCVSLCAARNIVRYQYRIKGEDCFDDYCHPWLIGGAAVIALSLTSYIICCLPVAIGIYSYFIAIIMKILQESENQLRIRRGIPGHYLSSPTSSYGVAAAPLAMHDYHRQHIMATANARVVPTTANVIPTTGRAVPSAHAVVRDTSGSKYRVQS